MAAGSSINAPDCGTMDNFLNISGEGGKSIVEVLKGILSEHTDELKQSLEYIVSESKSLRVFVDIENWKWIDYLDKEGEGSQVIAESSVKEKIYIFLLI